MRKREKVSKGFSGNNLNYAAQDVVYMYFCVYNNKIYKMQCAQHTADWIKQNSTHTYNYHRFTWQLPTELVKHIPCSK